MATTENSNWVAETEHDPDNCTAIRVVRDKNSGNHLAFPCGRSRHPKGSLHRWRLLDEDKRVVTELTWRD